MWRSLIWQVHPWHVVQRLKEVCLVMDKAAVFVNQGWQSWEQQYVGVSQHYPIGATVVVKVPIARDYGHKLMVTDLHS